MLALAVAAHEVAVGVLGELAGDPLLDLDARIAGALARWLQPGLVVSGTSLQAGEGPMVILVWGCSSLSHVGELLLLCWALTSLQRDDARPVSQARMAACLALLALFAVALNATRLTLMATSLESYEYLHGPQGGALFRCTLLVLAAAMSGACARAAAS
jgi:hypothetical protein